MDKQLPASTQKLANIIEEILSPEGIQLYILGTKKNGQPRAIYDILKDYNKPKKKKKHKKKKKDNNPYDFYVDVKKKKHKKKKKGKKDYWHI